MIETLYYIGLSQAIFVVLVLATKKQKQLSDFLLMGWLLTIAVKMAIRVVGVEFDLFLENQPSIAFVPLTFGPFLFLYTKNLIFKSFFLKNKGWVHFLPFFIFTALYFLFFKGKLTFDTHTILKADGYAFFRLLFGFSFIASVAYYSTLTFYLLGRYRKQMFDRFSYFSSANLLNWLYFLTTFYALTYVVYIALGIFNLIVKEEYFNVALISDIFLVLLTFSVSYFGIKQPYLFTVIPDEKEEDSEEDTIIPLKEKPKQATLEKEVTDGYIKLLEGYMIKEKPHLDPDLTVQDLSRKINIPRHHLTETLNNNIGKNFFTFINEYRIAEVKERLLHEDYAHLTIIAIAFDCGFNSKSTFNSIFKQQVGLTPSKWKKSIQQQ